MKSDSCDNGKDLAKGDSFVQVLPKLSCGMQVYIKRSGLYLKETPDPEKDFGVHGGSDAARLRVLLARVIDGE